MSAPFRRNFCASSFALASLISGGVGRNSSSVAVHGFAFMLPPFRSVIGDSNYCPRPRHNIDINHKRRLVTSTAAAADIVDGQPPGSARNNPLPSPNDLVGIVFDMDGTITRHCIDFAELRRRIYEIADDDCLEHDGECVLALADRMSPEGKQRAQDVFADIEDKAIEDMAFMDGLADLCRFIDDSGLKRAILTRNVRRSVDALHGKLQKDEAIAGFSPAMARDSVCEQGNPIRPKPAPDAILHICSAWGCEPRNVLMVGDSPADDIVAGYRAGCGARVLLAEGGVTRDNDTTGNGAPTDDEEIRQRTPCVTVSSLFELRDLLRKNNDNQ